MVSILIVRREEEARIDDCLASIHRLVTSPFQVILIDASTGMTDPSQSPCQTTSAQRFPQTKVLDGRNRTFAAAANLGATHALGRYLLVLSEDAVLRTDIADAVHILESDPAIGAVGAEKYSHEGVHRVSCARFPTPIRLWRFASMWDIPDTTGQRIHGVPAALCDYVDISFLLTRADAWKTVGGMDAKNSLYGDEMDYCRALRDHGLLTVHCRSVQYAHGGEYSPARLSHLIGGFRRYHRRFSSPLTRLHAEIALRAGLALRLPLYWWKSRRGDHQASLALRHTLRLVRNWNETDGNVSLNSRSPACPP